MNKILEVKHVSASYTTQGGAFSRDKVQIVLHDVSFDLYEGEALGLVGESGSGKTTIARAILGFLPAADLPGPVYRAQPSADRGLDPRRAAEDLREIR